MRWHHGDPDKFEKDVMRAYSHMHLTYEEAKEAIRLYRREYLSTPERLL